MNHPHYVITITRQFGSRSHEIIPMMAEKLGINFYDNDIIDSVAQQLNLPIEVVRGKEEKADTHKSNSFFSIASAIANGGIRSEDKIFQQQQELIQSLADRESCILVGRCSDFILSEYPNAVHIYIYAPYEDRVNNIMGYLNSDRTEAKRLIRRMDKEHDAYYANYAGYQPDNKNFKDIMVNTSFLGTQGTVDYLVSAIRQKFQLEG